MKEIKAVGCVLLLCFVAHLSARAADVSAAAPVPAFQGDFFGDMARAFGCVVSADTTARTLTVRLDRDDKLVTVPIRYDTELHMRDSWGELGDYFPGQHVMLFMYVDDEKNWTYPRAVQDDIHVSSIHKWYAAVTAIDKDAHTYSTHREEKDAKGNVTKKIDNIYSYADDVKVWKGAAPGGIDSLLIGDEVIQQLVAKDGKKVAVEILDRKGDDAVRALQDERHRKDEDKLGLPAYVNDFNTLTGALTITVAWSSSARGKQLKPAEVVAVQPIDGSKTFAAAVCSRQDVDTRQRVELLTRSHVISRLAVGQPLRVFMPGTGPALPTGKLGVPDFQKK